MTTDEKLKHIYNHFGKTEQVKQLRREVEELIQGIEAGDVENISEEIADVMVMLDQFRVANDLCTSRMWDIYRAKVDRTILRIETRYYENKAQAEINRIKEHRHCDKVSDKEYGAW